MLVPLSKEFLARSMVNCLAYQNDIGEHRIRGRFRVLRLYFGTCHCKSVQFEVSADISAGTTKCNCSLCSKLRAWSIQVTPDSFRLLAGAPVLRDYRGRNTVTHHFFCDRCGVHPFARNDTPNLKEQVYYNINIACLEEVDVDELVEAPIDYQDGKRDRWQEPPQQTRHL